jgi:hypothetical protein
MTDMEQTFKNMAKAMAVYAFRNTSIENLHSGKFPTSVTGDYSDVFVTDAKGNKIPWNDVSRISDPEMKTLMKEIVNSLYTFYHEINDPKKCGRFLNYNLSLSAKWDEPELNKEFSPLAK